MEKVSFTEYQQKIIDLTPAKIINAIDNFYVDKNTNELFVPFRGEGQEYFNERLVDTCRLLQYKYCMPIKVLSNRVLFTGYSTYKLIKLLYPNLGRRGSNLQLLIKTIDKIKDEKIVLYAAGAIEKSPDGGRGTRELLKNSLTNTKSVVVNPCDFEFNKGCLSLGEFKKKHTFGKTWLHCTKVVEADCAAVKAVDAIVLMLDKNVGSGSTSECTLARAMGKPVYAILCDDFKKEDTNVWLLGNVTRFFNSVDSFREFVTDIE